MLLVLPLSPATCEMGFSGGSDGKKKKKSPAALQETQGSIPGLGRSPGKGKGYPLRYSGLENFMDCIVHGVSKSRTPVSETIQRTEMTTSNLEVGCL